MTSSYMTPDSWRSLISPSTAENSSTVHFPFKPRVEAPLQLRVKLTPTITTSALLITMWLCQPRDRAGLVNEWRPRSLSSSPATKLISIKDKSTLSIAFSCKVFLRATKVGPYTRDFLNSKVWLARLRETSPLTCSRTLPSQTKRTPSRLFLLSLRLLSTKCSSQVQLTSNRSSHSLSIKSI